MIEILKYTLEAGIIFWIFQIFYNQVYYSLCYNKWNRIYLLASVFLSYLLPLAKIKHFEQRIDNPDFKILGIEPLQDGIDIMTFSREKTLSTLTGDFLYSAFFEISVKIIFAVYAAGVAVKLFAFARGLFKTLRLQKNTLTATLDNGIKIFETQLNVVAFSFFKNIFTGIKAKTLSEKDLETVFAHERQHIKNRDSLDTVIFGLFSALQWFNPCVKKAVKNSRIVCENIADSGVSSNSGLTEYSALLLRLGEKNVCERQVSGQKNGKRSSLSQRLMLLFNKDTDKVRKIRFLSTTVILAVVTAFYIVAIGILSPQKKGLNLPLKGNFRISAGYFENKLYTDSTGGIFEVRHPRTDFLACEGTEIISPVKAVAQKNGNEIILKTDDIEITTGGKIIFQDFLTSKEKLVNEGEVLGRVSGNNTLIYIKVTVNGRVVNPQKIFKL
jgi:hypothetical protein